MKSIFLRLTVIFVLLLAFLINAGNFAYGNNMPIEDELLNPDVYTNTPFRLNVYENKYSKQPITDELLENDDFATKARNHVISSQAAQDDFFIEKNIDVTKVRKIKHKNIYDFTKKAVPIRIKIAKCLKSTGCILEGDTIPFIAQHTFVINGKKYDSGTTILGRVEIISASDKMGVPESLKISNFYIPGEKEIELHGSISKNGANRSIWVYPLYQAGNITFYVAGFIFVPIHGGRAKLLTSESFTVYFES